MKVTGEAQVRCAKCGATVYIPGDALIMEQTTSDERGMGAEVGYEGTTAIECANCDNEINIVYEATEYPVGAVNFAEATVNGGSMIVGFTGVELVDVDEV